MENNNIQFKRDKKQNSKKLHLDQYYTSDELAQYCIDKTLDAVGVDNITEFIEPSAGTGVFNSKLKNCTSYDIEPKADDIIKADFLELDIPYKKGRVVIGNPPYGSRLNLAKAFCNKSFDIAEYVSFILPISQLNNTQSIYKYDLIYSEDLGKRDYSGINVHCCLNVYRRPTNGEFNSIQRFRDSEIIEIIEVIQNNNPKRNRELGDFEYDFAICAWGDIGKVCNDGDYAKTFFIKIKDICNFEYYKTLILSADWKTLYPMTNVPNLLQWQVYKYVLDNKI